MITYRTAVIQESGITDQNLFLKYLGPARYEVFIRDCFIGVESLVQNNIPELIILSHEQLDCISFTPFDFLARFRRDQRLHNTAIFFTSPNEKDRKKALESGADGFIIKPLDPRKFKKVVGKINGRVKARALQNRRGLPDKDNPVLFENNYLKFS